MLTPDNAHGYRMPKSGRRVLAGVLVLLFAVMAGLWANAMHNQRKEAAARAVAEHRADQLDTASVSLQKRTAALLKANHRLLVHGQQPVKIPNVPTPEAGPAGPAGPSPTRAQVFEAVAEFCSSGACEHGPTASQVETAVAVYCSSRDDCRGVVGRTGSQGAPGVGTQGPAGPAGPGGANGQDGQNATDAQVAAAVNAYCDAHNQCQGPTGATGAQGDQGPKGDPGTAQPGTYTCPQVTPFLHGFTVNADGSVDIDCIPFLGNSGPD